MGKSIYWEPFMGEGSGYSSSGGPAAICRISHVLAFLGCPYLFRRFSQLSTRLRGDKGAEIGAEIADLIRQISRAVGFFLALRPSSSSPLASASSPTNSAGFIMALASMKNRSLPATWTAAFSSNSVSQSFNGSALARRCSNKAKGRPLAIAA